MGLIRSVRGVKFENVDQLWFTIKASAIGGILYYTYYEGLWSKPEESTKLYGKIYKNVAPYITHSIPDHVIHELHQLPSITSVLKTQWNAGVMAIMKGIADVPKHTKDGATKLYKTVEGYLQQVES